MKRGFLFTIAFGLLFLVFLSAAMFYAREAQEQESIMLRTHSQRERTIAYDVAATFLQLFSVNASIENGATQTALIVRDSAPFPEYPIYKPLFETLLAEEYSRALNVNVSAKVDTFSGLVLWPHEIRYGYSGLNKKAVYVDGNAVSYEIHLNLTSKCDGDCSSVGSWNWSTNGIPVKTYIYDKDGVRVTLNGSTEGFLSIGETGTATVPLQGGYLKLEFNPTPQRLTSTLDMPSQAVPNAQNVMFRIGANPGKPVWLTEEMEVSIGDRKITSIPVIEK